MKSTKPIVLCICGLAGSGKSTTAKKLAGKFHLKYLSGGDALRELAKEKGYKQYSNGWWESKEGLCFLENRSKNFEYDTSVDKKLLDLAKKGNVVLDSWTMPWLLQNGFKIWLEASTRKRAERVAKRDHLTLEEVSKALQIKEEKTINIYKRLYNFYLGKDFTPFNLILDTEFLTVEEVFKILCSVINNVLFSSGVWFDS